MNKIVEGFFNNILFKARLLSIEERSKIESRVAICKPCEKNYYDSNTKSARCGICGCFINLLVAQDKEKCKLSKW